MICEGARPTVPSPLSPSQTGVNALLVGEGQGEGWRRSTERKVTDSRTITDYISWVSDTKTDAVRVVPLSLSLPHKGPTRGEGTL
jgi:hypothetical protein